MPRPRLLALGMLLLGLAVAEGGWAQPIPPLAWERVGTGESIVAQKQVQGLAFRLGDAPDGSRDTLYAVVSYGVYRLTPGAPDWEPTCTQARCSSEFMTATKEGHLLIGAPTGPTADGARSTDGGFTWEHDAIGASVTVLFQSTLPALDGAVYACNGAFCARSYEGGAPGSWLSADPLGGIPDALAEVRPSAALPEGRLLGGVWNGAVYSDDGGRTWTRSALWGPGRFVVRSLTFAPAAGHPYGGVAFAGVRDFSLGRPGVYRSDDGGQTWALVRAVEPGDFGVASPIWIEVLAGPDGILYAGVGDWVPGPPPSVGLVLASTDGGQTWAVVGDSTNGWGGYAVDVFAVGRDGRLYAGTGRGVWRTVDPLPVEAEALAPQQAGGHLGAPYPNPARGPVTVPLMLAQPGAVRVAVYDVLGREVAVLHDGPLGPGEHAFRLDASALPAGVYVVRATGGPSLARRLTVVR